MGSKRNRVMKYLMRTLLMILYVVGFVLIVSGFIIFMLLILVQIPIWFVWKGELLEDDETWLVWYIENVIGWAEDVWEKILKWSRK
jgi:hypothetical protein